MVTAMERRASIFMADIRVLTRNWMRGGASPAAGVSNNKRDLAERQPMIMPKSERPASF